jgi:thioredoxin reductase (NADPH)
VKGENEFLGKGISYCATCDAAFFRKKKVAVVGGGNSAAMAAILLTEFAEKVSVIYRGEKLRADPAVAEKVYSNPKIEVLHKANIVEIKGEKFVNSVVLDNGSSLELNGVFIEVGSVPSTALAKILGVNLDEQGYIQVDKAQKTNVEGVFAAGDITTNSNNLRQVITAAAEGAIAAESAYKFLKH